jgi:hypothetical protein
VLVLQVLDLLPQHIQLLCGLGHGRLMRLGH